MRWWPEKAFGVPRDMVSGNRMSAEANGGSSRRTEGVAVPVSQGPQVWHLQLLSPTPLRPATGIIDSAM